MKISINLLTADRKKSLCRFLRTRLIVRNGILFLSVPLVVCAVLGVMVYMVRVEYESMVIPQLLENRSQMSQELDRNENFIKQTNRQVARLDNFMRRRREFAPILFTLAAAVPENVSLNEIVLTSDKKREPVKATIGGLARTRDDVLSFRDVLRSHRCFENVDIPLSSVVNKNDVDFTLSATVVEKCLQAL